MPHRRRFSIRFSRSAGPSYVGVTTRGSCHQFAKGQNAVATQISGGDDEEDFVDVFEEMTLAEHLDELRSRLVKTCIGIGLAFIVGLFLTRPLLGLVRDNANVERFDVIEATEPITSFFKTALYIAIAFALPLIFYQIFAFVSPGSDPQRKALRLRLAAVRGDLLPAGRGFRLLPGHSAERSSSCRTSTAISSTIRRRSAVSQRSISRYRWVWASRSSCRSSCSCWPGWGSSAPSACRPRVAMPSSS